MHCCRQIEDGDAGVLMCVECACWFQHVMFKNNLTKREMTEHPKSRDDKLIPTAFWFGKGFACDMCRGKAKKRDV